MQRPQAIGPCVPAAVALVVRDEDETPVQILGTRGAVAQIGREALKGGAVAAVAIVEQFSEQPRAPRARVAGLPQRRRYFRSRVDPQTVATIGAGLSKPRIVRSRKGRSRALERDEYISEAPQLSG